jgi:hypothetical protein
LSDFQVLTSKSGGRSLLRPGSYAYEGRRARLYERLLNPLGRGGVDPHKHSLKEPIAWSGDAAQQLEGVKSPFGKGGFSGGYFPNPPLPRF